MTPSQLVEAVTFDAELSTVYAEVYWSHVGTTSRKVVYEPRTQKWRCEDAKTREGALGHIARAKRVRMIRCWLALCGDYSDDELALLAANRALLQASGQGTDEDQAAIDAATIIMGRRHSRAA